MSEKDLFTKAKEVGVHTIRSIEIDGVYADNMNECGVLARLVLKHEEEAEEKEIIVVISGNLIEQGLLEGMKLRYELVKQEYKKEKTLN